MENKPLFLLLFAITACQTQLTEEFFHLSPPEILPVPTREGGAPNLFVSESGQVLLSWVEYLNDSTDALLYSKLEGKSWSQPKEVVRGNDWFVNWADFPSMVAYQGEETKLAAHWLQKSAQGTYDYDVRVAQSVDGGENWSLPFIPHTDGIAAEHGFVTMFPTTNGRIFATWLDGRNTKEKDGQEEQGGHGHGHGGAMTLRTAEFDAKGALFAEAELDERICDCCQTDAAMTSVGPIVVYRDRSEEEVRDISIVRKVNGQWTRPQYVFNDAWKIAGCPVNGPAIAAQDQAVVVAWFTSAGGENQVKVAFSNNAGEKFSAPIRVDDGKPVGRVDVVLLDVKTALVSWIETVGEQGEVRLALVGAEGKTGESMTAIETGVSRQSGFPILAKVKDDLLLAWTIVEAGKTKVATAYFRRTDL